MDVTDWARVQTLFEQALEYEPDVRTAFLRRACGDDPALYEEVAALLAADEDTHPLLDGLALDAIAVSEEDLLGGARTETVGPWRLGNRVGRGGMGEVFRAERAEGGFAQTAALKLIKRGMDSEAVVRRFEAERQILARLGHPGIARLLDGGVAEDGRPFFAMEFVEGVPITDYCDNRRLPVEGRLRLFAAVCEAVRYAHRNLVVHRDLKPSNILVAEDGEGRPTVKLLDFGIARLLETDDDALLTQTGHRVLTPAYAAPEQITGDAVTTATDVYALGGLLYRLLCGRPPIETEGRTARELEQAVLEETPRPPSAHSSEEAATARGTTAERLGRRLRGDLDTIALAALHKEPERRYGSAAELLEDVTRHLDGLPIDARRDSRGYRVRKFVARHRAGVLATAGVVALVALLVGFYTARLAAERDRAQQEASKAAEVSAFLASLFESADPAQSRGAEVTARELLAEGARRIETELAGQPEVQAEMFGTIGRVYQSLGLQDEAAAALERSLTLLHTTGAGPLALARAETALGDLRVDQGNFGAADSLLRRALAAQRAGYDGPHEDTAETLETLGIVLQESGDYTAAEAPLREALVLQRALHGGDHERTASLLNSLGQTLFDLGRYDASAQHYAAALAMRRRLHGDLHPSVTESLRELATLQRRQKAFGDAERLIREAIALDSQLVGLEHPNIGEDFYEYASLLKDMGRYDDATRAFERTLAVDLATLGPDHPYVALTLGELGQVREGAGDPAGAITYYRRALALQRRVLPPDHPELATMLNKLGSALLKVGTLDEAERVIREGLAVRRASLDEDHPAVLSDRSGLAAFLTRTGRHDEAIAEHRDILERRRRTLGDDSPTTARSYYNLAAALRLEGTPTSLAEARAAAEEAVARYRAAFPPESREMGYVLMEQADVLRAAGDADEAVAVYREADRVFRAALGSDHPILGRIERTLAEMNEG